MWRVVHARRKWRRATVVAAPRARLHGEPAVSDDAPTAEAEARGNCLGLRFDKVAPPTKSGGGDDGDEAASAASGGVANSGVIEWVPLERVAPLPDAGDAVEAKHPHSERWVAATVVSVALEGDPGAAEGDEPVDEDGMGVFVKVQL